MRKDYLDRIVSENGWLFNDKEMFLIVTDDLDSLFSALLILKYRKNTKIGGYFDYRDGYYENLANEVELDQDNTIWVDCSSVIQGDKCISNHLTSICGKVHNVNDINLNSIDNNYRDKDYFQKYNLSTFLLLTSLFSHKIESRAGMALSLGFDSAYKAYYQPWRFADAGVQKRYLCDVMELEDIYNVQKELDISKFKNMSNVLNLDSKVYMTDKGIRCKSKVDLEIISRYLDINVDLKCLDGEYERIFESRTDYKTVNYMRNKELQNNRITSFAITGNNNISFSYIVVKED